MKVKCIKTKIDKFDMGVINSDLTDYISTDSLFWVYGVRFSKPAVYLYIFDKDHLLEVPKDLFEIIDNKVPDQWVIKFWDNGDVTLWPKLFYEQNFLENFAEREEYERGLFINLRKIVEEEGD